MNTEDRIDISILNDAYGSLLTAHQTEMIRLYYDCDVSLNEIAEQYSISRQAVRDAIMRGERSLREYEAKLHIIEKSEVLGAHLHALKDRLKNEDAIDEVDSLIAIVEGD